MKTLEILNNFIIRALNTIRMNQNQEETAINWKLKIYKDKEISELFVFKSGMHNSFITGVF